MRQIEDERRAFERLLEERITSNYLRRCVNVHTVKSAGEEILEKSPHFKEALGPIKLAPRYVYGFLKRSGRGWNLLKGNNFFLYPS